MALIPKKLGMMPGIIKEYLRADVPAGGIALPIGPGPHGVIGVLGAPTGYQYSFDKGEANPWLPLNAKTRIRWQPNLTFRTKGQVTGSLVLGYYEICDPENGDEWETAFHNAGLHAGDPIADQPGGATVPPSTQTTAFASATLVGPIYIRTAWLVAGSTDGGPALIQVGPDTGTPGGVNDPTAVICFASSSTDAANGNGIFASPGGSFNWAGGTLYGSEQTPNLPGLMLTYATAAYG